MPFKIVRNDITKVRADAIVNTANPMPVVGRGTDSTIYEAAGLERLLAAREKIGVIEHGQSAWTPAFNLKKHGVKYIIHTSGVFYRGGKHGEKEILRSCYQTSLNMAESLKCKSVAIPLLASGNYGFPKELALQIAVEEISRFLLEHEVEVQLVVYDEKSYKISEKLFDDVEDFLSDNLEKPVAPVPGDWSFGAAASVMAQSFSAPVQEPKRRDGCFKSNRTTPNKQGARSGKFARSDESAPVPIERLAEECRAAPVEDVPCDAEPVSMSEMGQMADAAVCSEEKIAPIDVDAFINSSKDKLNFQNTLMQLIADRQLENSFIYKKACIDKKFFSKIISNKDYVPKKHTVMALGLALELPLEEYERFLASAGYAFMPSSKFDLIVKYCVMNQIYNLISVDVLLNDHGEECFAPA